MTRVEKAEIQPGARLVVHSEPSSFASDRFRYLRLRLNELWETGKLKTILITSALPQDGKSTVALNLASALCEGGKRKVLLIEADLHRPALTPLLGLEPGPGLVECLQEGAHPSAFLRRLDPLAWWLLPAGGQCANPTELLQSTGLSKVLEELAPQFDWILIDSPPVIPVTDSVAMVKDVDATLMVVRAGSTPRDLVQRTLALLGRKKFLGVVLNASDSLHRASKHGYYESYSYPSRTQAKG